MQELSRKGLGVCIWLSNAYMQMVMPTNLLCRHMADPSHDTLKHLKAMIMHMVAFPHCNTYGGWGVVGLEQPVDLITPFSEGTKAMYFHYFSDSNLDIPSVSGGVGMLAGGPIITRSANQHLAAPNSHAAEVVSAGDNLNSVMPVNGILQEIGIRQGASTPYYLDSNTTVFVSSNDAAAKKSVWMMRRVVVLHEGVTMSEITPIHITEKDMVADPLTKYLKQVVWARHMKYGMNYDYSH